MESGEVVSAVCIMHELGHMCQHSSATTGRVFTSGSPFDRHANLYCCVVFEEMISACPAPYSFAMNLGARINSWRFSSNSATMRSRRLANMQMSTCVLCARWMTNAARRANTSLSLPTYRSSVASSVVLHPRSCSAWMHAWRDGSTRSLWAAPPQSTVQRLWLLAWVVRSSSNPAALILGLKGGLIICTTTIVFFETSVLLAIVYTSIATFPMSRAHPSTPFFQPDVNAACAC